MRLISLLLITLLMHDFASSQITNNPPELDENILQSKQYKRLLDFAKKRKHGDAQAELLKWQAFEKAQFAEKANSRNTTWQNHGPDTVSGRIISIAFHPNDPNTSWLVQPAEAFGEPPTMVLPGLAPPTTTSPWALEQWLTIRKTLPASSLLPEKVTGSEMSLLLAMACSFHTMTV